jgi:hypothetical protein
MLEPGKLAGDPGCLAVTEGSRHSSLQELDNQ